MKSTSKFEEGAKQKLTFFLLFQAVNVSWPSAFKTINKF